MARKNRSNTLENRTGRLKLAPRRKPYPGPSLARGVRQDYRRNIKGNGTWVANVADGHGGYTTRRIADADDFDESNGKSILNFFEAQDQIKALGQGSAVHSTLDSVLIDYKADLIAGSSNPYNADWPRVHLTSELLAKPIVLLTAPELKKWRDGLVGIKTLATLNRLSTSIRAALNFAARQDPRIKNQSAWETGLANLPNPDAAHNVVLNDDQVRAFVTVSYDLDYAFGLFAEVVAGTGARPSQVSRLRVEDLRMHPVKPTLMMPKSGKGGKRDRVERKAQHYSIPITSELAVKLQLAGKGRKAAEPLLIRDNGEPWGVEWGVRLNSSYRRRVNRVAVAIGLDPAEVTMYCLRHSSIVRMLLKNVPTRVVAAVHDTSIPMIESHYSKHITDYSDDVSRAALLQHKVPGGANVIRLPSTARYPR